MLHTGGEHTYHVMNANVYGQGYSVATGLYGDNISALRSAFGNLPYAFFIIGSLGYSDVDFPDDSGGGLPGLEETHVVYEPLSRFA